MNQNQPNLRARPNRSTGRQICLVAAIGIAAFVAASPNATATDQPIIDAGSYNTCILSNGDLSCWGAGTIDTDTWPHYGQSISMQHPDAVDFSTGGFHTCVLKASGNVACWGYNLYGQTEAYLQGDAVDVSVGGESHTCVLTTSRNVDCWGSTWPSPAADYVGGDALAVSAGGYHTCVLLEGGNVDCFGSNWYGQAEDYLGGDAVSVSAGRYHSCAVLNAGNVECWGFNDLGQNADYLGGDAIAVGAGAHSTCALLQDGDLFCWGYLASELSYTGGDAVSFTMGGRHRCVQTTAGDNLCAGSDQYGQLGGHLPPTLVVPDEIVVDAAGPDGTVVTWTATATDDDGGAAAVACSPASGSAFAVGATTVTCTATDRFLSTASASFPVTVRPVTPEAPRNLHATHGEEPLHAILAWDAPAWDGGATVESYHVYRFTDSGVQQVGTTPDRSFEVPICGPVETCHYVVRAENAVGEGTASDHAAAPGLAGVPAIEGSHEGFTLYVDGNLDGARDEEEAVATLPRVA